MQFEQYMSFVIEKSSECSVFLNYIVIDSLHKLLPENHFKMFVNLFCAVTICSSDYYRRFLPVAHKFFENFIAYHYQLFTSVTTNVHNLIHVSQECGRLLVRRFVCFLFALHA